MWDYSAGDKKCVIRLRVARSDDEARLLLESQRSCPCRVTGLLWVPVNPCSVRGDSGYRDNKRNKIEALREAIFP
jgi:hypothetical protein